MSAENQRLENILHISRLEVERHTGFARAEYVRVLLERGYLSINSRHPKTGSSYVQYVCQVYVESRSVPSFQQVIDTLLLYVKNLDFDINRLDNRGHALLHDVAQMRNPAFLKCLLENAGESGRLNINLLTVSPLEGFWSLIGPGKSALCIVLVSLVPNHRTIQKLKMLLRESNIDVDVRNGQGGETVLYKVIRSIDFFLMSNTIEEVVRLLLTKGNKADPNIFCNGRTTPFLALVAKDNINENYMRLLCDLMLNEGGANPYLKNSDGQNAFDIVQSSNYNNSNSRVVLKSIYNWDRRRLAICQINRPGSSSAFRWLPHDTLVKIRELAIPPPKL